MSSIVQFLTAQVCFGAKLDMAKCRVYKTVPRQNLGGASLKNRNYQSRLHHACCCKASLLHSCGIVMGSSPAMAHTYVTASSSFRKEDHRLRESCLFRLVSTIVELTWRNASFTLSRLLKALEVGKIGVDPSQPFTQGAGSRKDWRRP